MSDEQHDPEFGPGGYLPGKAAKRARKIVLRAELGLQWVIASIVAALVVLIAGVVWWQGRSTVPDGYVEVALIEGVRSDGHLEFGVDPLAGGPQVLILQDAGTLRVFPLVTEVMLECRRNGRIEAKLGPDDYRVWSRTGRSLDGREGLATYPSLLDGDAVYANPTAALPAPRGPDEEVEPACRELLDDLYESAERRR